MQDMKALWQGLPPGVEFQAMQRITAPTPLHFHDELQLSLVEQGSLSYQIGKQHFRASCGQLIIWPQSVPHAGQPSAESGWSFRTIFVNPSFMAKLAAENSLKQIEFAFPLAALENNRLNLTIRASFEATSRLEQQTQLFTTLLDLMQSHAESLPTLPQTYREHQAMRLVRDYLTENFAQEIELEDLCKLTNLSKAYLIRAFHKTYGMPPHLFQTQTRLLQAKLLLSQNIPLSQIAQLTGFAHQSHFHRHFKRIFGFTPGYYQKMVTFVQD